MKNSYKIILPFIFALLLATGVYLGSRLNFSSPSVTFLNRPEKVSDKLNSVLNYIEEEYVDTVNNSELIDKAIIELLKNLDPHSAYLTAEEVKQTREPLEGNFEGIGIEFNIISDTIRVISVISGGPSERAGLMAGDKIVKVNQENAAGVKMKNRDVMNKLRGKGGTEVTVGIKRGNSKELLFFTITRGTIPLYSVDVSYMLDKETGYIKISRFAGTTHEEFLEHTSRLRANGMKLLLLDLRGNGGGLLSSSISISDEFLESGKVIVYTDGKSHPKETIKATRKGILSDTKVAVLIDESSASASEIVSGAIQDNDRGVIVGRRSFGKGLVQRETMFRDSSALRLTVARYYTPTGRCIQRPYSNGTDEYYADQYERFRHGELVNVDSVKVVDSLKFVTPGGKVVYGGGGIQPDIFVSLDTAGRNAWVTELFTKGVFNKFSFDYADRKRALYKPQDRARFINSFVVGLALFNEFLEESRKIGVKKEPMLNPASEKLVRKLIKASIARQLWGNDGFYPIYNEKDPVIEAALNALNG